MGDDERRGLVVVRRRPVLRPVQLDGVVPPRQRALDSDRQQFGARPRQPLPHRLDFVVPEVLQERKAGSVEFIRMSDGTFLYDDMHSSCGTSLTHASHQHNDEKRHAGSTATDCAMHHVLVRILGSSQRAHLVIQQVIKDNYCSYHQLRGEQRQRIPACSSAFSLAGHAKFAMMLLKVGISFCRKAVRQDIRGVHLTWHPHRGRSQCAGS